MELFPLIKVFILAAVSFVIAMAWTPLLTTFLYRHNLGKRIRESVHAPIYARMHAKKAGTPTMGGVLVWGTVLGLAVLLSAGARLTGWAWMDNFSFLSRGETLLPLGALVASALVGLVDDLFNVWKKGVNGGGLRMRHRLLLYTAIAAVGAWWFYQKLGADFLHIPFVGNISLGLWYIPVFMFIVVATAFSVNEIDGLDGLAGGTLLAAFAAYGTIAFVQGYVDLASFIAVIIGGLLAFLWFNIPPARFFMGDTGSMSLGVTLAIIAMLTNSELLLPLIGFLFVVESLSVIIQITSRIFLKRKVFLVAPLHHHFEAVGWPEEKIVMRFWVIAGMTGVIGLVLFFADRVYG